MARASMQRRRWVSRLRAICFTDAFPETIVAPICRATSNREATISKSPAIRCARRATRQQIQRGHLALRR